MTQMRDYQKRVHDWMLITFGRKIAADTVERSHRFLEEALELVQACGMPRAEVLDLVSYTYGRERGEIKQEVGGVSVTLAALCSAQYISLDDAANVELDRCFDNVERIRAKQAGKPKHGPRPE